MKLAGNNNNGIVCNLVNKAMFTCDSAGPTTFELIFQRFGFPNAIKRIAVDVFEKFNYSVSNLSVGISPFNKL